MPECVIFDIDGTLADLTHRREHLLKDPRDWDAFYEAMVDDPLIYPIWRLYRTLRDDHTIILCSGRPEDYRTHTQDWLSRHGIFYNKLMLRPSGDYREDTLIKREMLWALRADGWEPLLVVEDRQRVVDMWREQGIVCLQCAPGDFDIGPPK